MHISRPLSLPVPALYPPPFHKRQGKKGINFAIIASSTLISSLLKRKTMYSPDSRNFNLTETQKLFNAYLDQADSFRQHLDYKRDKIQQYSGKSGYVVQAMAKDLELCLVYRDACKGLIEDLLFNMDSNSTVTEKIAALECRVKDFWRAFDAFGIPRGRVVDTLNGMR